MVKIAVSCIVLVFLCSSCGSNSAENLTSVGTAECVPEIRLSGVIYTGAGTIEGDPETKKFGRADQAECADVGADAQGSFYSENPQQVRVLKLKGTAPEDAVAVRGRGGLHLFVTDQVDDSSAARMLRELGVAR